MNEWRLLEGSGKRNSNFPNSSYLTSKKKKKKNSWSAGQSLSNSDESFRRFLERRCGKLVSFSGFISDHLRSSVGRIRYLSRDEWYSLDCRWCRGWWWCSDAS